VPGSEAKRMAPHAHAECQLSLTGHSEAHVRLKSPSAASLFAGRAGPSAPLLTPPPPLAPLSPGRGVGGEGTRLAIHRMPIDSPVISVPSSRLGPHIPEAIVSEAEVSGSLPKQSFEDMRSQTGVWERVRKVCHCWLVQQCDARRVRDLIPRQLRRECVHLRQIDTLNVDAHPGFPMRPLSLQRPSSGHCWASQQWHPQRPAIPLADSKVGPPWQCHQSGKPK
jgi:hypothetical protein